MRPDEPARSNRRLLSTRTTSWLLKYKNTPHPPRSEFQSPSSTSSTQLPLKNIKGIEKQSSITHPRQHPTTPHSALDCGTWHLDQATDFGSPKKCCSLESFNKNTHHIQSSHVVRVTITALPLISIPIEAESNVGHANILPRSHCPR